jgi:hypothetical protein
MPRSCAAVANEMERDLLRPKRIFALGYDGPERADEQRDVGLL